MALSTKNKNSKNIPFKLGDSRNSVSGANKTRKLTDKSSSTAQNTSRMGTE